MNTRSTLSMIHLRGSNLYVGNFIIPLHGRKKMHQLIWALFPREEGLSRQGIRRIMYQNGDESLMSFRLIDSQDSSLSKLISRSRRYLKLSLADTPWARAIEWFVYDETTKLWKLLEWKESQPVLHTQTQVEEINLIKNAAQGGPK